MTERSPLLEMLVLESKGYLNIGPKRVIEMCSGWNEGSCDDDLMYRKYIEVYHIFLSTHTEYVIENLTTFGIVTMFEDIEDLISEGLEYKSAVSKAIRNVLSITHIPLAEPPHEYLSEKYQSGLKMNPNYLDTCLFEGRIEQNSIYFEIVD